MRIRSFFIHKFVIFNLFVNHELRPFYYFFGQWLFTTLFNCCCKFLISKCCRDIGLSQVPSKYSAEDTKDVYK